MFLALRRALLERKVSLSMSLIDILLVRLPRVLAPCLGMPRAAVVIRLGDMDD